MVVIVGKEVLHPVGIFETAGMVKAQGEGTVPGAHIKCLQIRIIGKDIFNQAAAVSLSMELGGCRYIFKLIYAGTFFCHHAFRPDCAVCQHKHIAPLQVAVHHILLFVCQQEQVQILLFVLFYLNDFHD